MSHAKYSCADGTQRKEWLFQTQPLLKRGMLTCQEMEGNHRVPSRYSVLTCQQDAVSGQGLGGDVLGELMTGWSENKNKRLCIQLLLP